MKTRHSVNSLTLASRAILAALVLVLTACASTSVRPSAGQGSALPRWLTFQIRQVTIQANTWDGLTNQAEIQVYTIVTDGSTSARLSYPADGFVAASVGQTIPLSKFALSVDQNAVENELLVYILVVDVDEQSPEVELVTNVVLDLLTAALVTAATQGVGLPVAAEIGLGTLASMGTGGLADWARHVDVIGEEAFVLRRSSGWEAGPAVTHTTADGGLQIVYQIYLGEELSSDLAWVPPTPTAASSDSSEVTGPKEDITKEDIIGVWECGPQFDPWGNRVWADPIDPTKSSRWEFRADGTYTRSLMFLGKQSEMAGAYELTRDGHLTVYDPNITLGETYFTIEVSGSSCKITDRYDAFRRCTRVP